MLALFLTSLSGLMPEQFFASLHASRGAIAAYGIGEVRTQLTALAAEEARLGATSDQLAARADSAEANTASVRSEVGTLAARLPRLTATIPISGAIDTSTLTGSIDPVQHGFSPRVPAPESIRSAPAVEQPLPPALTPKVSQPVVIPLPPPSLATIEPAMARQPTTAPVAIPAQAPTGPVVTAVTAQDHEKSPAQGSNAMTWAARLFAAVDSRAAPSKPSIDVQPKAIVSSPEATQHADHLQAAMPPLPRPAPLRTARIQPPAHPAQLAEKAPVPLTRPQQLVGDLPDPAQKAQFASSGQALNILQTSAKPSSPSPKANARQIGIAVGAPVEPGSALGAWQDLASKIGVMLVGTSPLLADDPGGSGGKVLVAGPIPDISKAAELCAKVDATGVGCTPMPYVGTDLLPAAEIP
ncbi:MAG TPA: hypothetical protein VL418_17580 [Devosiaceae bacterium]|nr:hypothetical protein [Devosiaceae bacterium]